jgi:uncharacterized protein YndB with AHSA1/START domain
MASDILHDFPIRAPVSRVFDSVSTPAGLDQWWTKQSTGTRQEGAVYALQFGPGFDWRATVSKCAPGSAFELTITRADADWMGTRVGFQLEPRENGTRVRFRHTGWPTANEHYRISCYCWAMYLRVLKRHLEHGENVPYEERLEV